MSEEKQETGPLKQIVYCENAFERSKSLKSKLALISSFIPALIRRHFRWEQYYFASVWDVRNERVISLAVAAIGVTDPLPVFQLEAVRIGGGEPWQYQIIFFKRINKTSYDCFAHFNDEMRRRHHVQSLKPEEQSNVS